jgi:Fic family protein
VVDNKLMFNEKVLLDIHSLILQGIDRLNAGSYRRDNVRISGSSHICPNFRKVPTHMEEYFQWYENIKETLHPVDLASQAHQKLVSIHPFIDGNGRTARLIMNLILLQNGYPITVIASDRKKRDKYYDSLESSHSSQINEKNQFQLLVAEYVKKWVFEYLHLIAPSGNGESKSKGYYFFKKIAPYIDKQ